MCIVSILSPQHLWTMEIGIILAHFGLFIKVFANIIVLLYECHTFTNIMTLCLLIVNILILSLAKKED